jgi:hypothetical protein
MTMGFERPVVICLFLVMRYAAIETSLMAVKTSTKTITALTALKALQEDAKRKGLDKLTLDEINAEIAQYRREKRLKVKRPKVR